MASRRFQPDRSWDFPSNHAAIMSLLMWGFVFTAQWLNAGLALAVLMIVIFEATALHRELGRQAFLLNELTNSHCRLLTVFFVLYGIFAICISSIIRQEGRPT
jgi:hypothetical protein